MGNGWRVKMLGGQEKGVSTHIQPPNMCLLPNKREEQGQGIEDDIGLTILDEGPNLRSLNAQTRNPNGALDGHRGQERRNSRRGQHLRLPLQRDQLLDGLLEDLQERDDHDDGEDQDAEGLEAAPPDGEALLQGVEPPLHEPVRGPHDERAEEVEGGIDQRRDERQRARRQDRGDLAREQQDVRHDVDVDSPAGPAALLRAPPPLLLRQQLPDIAPDVLQAAPALHVAVVVRVRVHGLQHVVGERHDHGVDLEPVVEAVVLPTIKLPHRSALDPPQLRLALPVLLQPRVVDPVVVQEGPLQVLAPRVFERELGRRGRGVLEPEGARARAR